MAEQNQEVMAIQEPHNQNTLDVDPIKHSVDCVFVLRKPVSLCGSDIVATRSLKNPIWIQHYLSAPWLKVR